MGLIGEHEDLAAELIRYSRLCYDRGLVVGSGGNLSARRAGSPVILVTASGVALRDVARENLMAVDPGGRVLEGPSGFKPSKEIGFHLEVFRRRPAVNAVVHVHPAHAIVYASRREPIPLVTISAQLKLRQGPIVPDAPPGSPDLCEAVSRAVETAGPEATVFLMARHGLLACGGGLCAAFDDAELAAETARTALLMAADGAAIRSAPAPADLGLPIVDLSIPLSASTACYPTDPPFRRTVHTDFPEAGAYVSRIEMGAHIGTHVDAPLHVLEKGSSLSDLPPQRFLGPAVALETPKRPGEDIEPADFAGAVVREGDILLFRTGWEERAGTSRFFQGDWPGFSPAAVEELIRRRVKAVGLDSPSADGPRGIRAGFISHRRLLSAGIPVFEALVNLGRVTGRRFFFIGLPLNIEHGEASPVRAVALLGGYPS